MVASPPSALISMLLPRGVFVKTPPQGAVVAALPAPICSGTNRNYPCIPVIRAVAYLRSVP